MSKASIYKNYFCKKCSWPIVHACCNDDMNDSELFPGDWFLYCSNKGCKNHHGVGICGGIDETPSFCVWNKSEENYDLNKVIDYCIERIQFIDSLVQQGVIPGQLDSIELQQCKGRIKELKDVIKLVTFLKNQYD